MRLFEVITPDLQQFTDMLRSKYDLQDLWLHDSGGDLKLDSIRVAKDTRKQGIGSAVMQEITRYADQNGLRVILTAGQKDDGHGTTSHSRLVKFYKRFGFKQNKGRHKDYTVSAGMIRDPR